MADVDLKGWVWWVRPSNCSPEVLLSPGFIAFLLYWGCSFVESLPCKLLCLRLLGFHWAILPDLLVGSNYVPFRLCSVAAIFNQCWIIHVCLGFALMANLVPMLKSIELSTSMFCNSLEWLVIISHVHSIWDITYRWCCPVNSWFLA